MKFLKENEKLRQNNQSYQKNLKKLSDSIEHTCMKNNIENTFLNNFKIKENTPNK